MFCVSALTWLLSKFTPLILCNYYFFFYFIYFFFLNILNNENQIFNNLSESEKLSYILNPSTPSQVNKLGSILKKSLELRTGDS
jgi:hypothetical protein